MTRFDQNTFNFEVHSAEGYEDFLVALPNQEAVKWIETWSKWDVPAVIIYGPKGCGKSHLVNLFKLNSHSMLVTNDMIRCDGAFKILEMSTNCVIDNVDLDTPEEGLLHLFNGISASKGHFLMTASRAPKYWDIKLKDLDSRLKSIPSVAIGLPDDRLLEAVIAKLFSDRQLIVNSDVILYLISRIERSLAAAYEIVEEIDKHSLSTGRKITLTLIRQVLNDRV